MPEMPSNQYVEIRNEAYYVAGTRIGLDIIIRDFRNGQTAEEIYRSYFSTVPLSRIYGAILFILENPEAIEQYLKDQERRWKQLYEMYPMPQELLDQLEEADERLSQEIGVEIR
jgi:uncharacterized protein (DUF433 family)